MRTRPPSFYDLYTPYDTCSTPQRDTCHIAESWLPQGCRAGVDTARRSYFCGLLAGWSWSLDGVDENTTRVCPQQTSGRCSTPPYCEGSKWPNLLAELAHLEWPTTIGTGLRVELRFGGCWRQTRAPPAPTGPREPSRIVCFTF